MIAYKLIKNYAENRIITTTFNDAQTPVPTADKRIEHLETWFENYEHLSQKDPQTLYNTFHIPKNSGGLRRIDAPSVEISEALNNLRNIFEIYFVIDAHDAAFAYVKGRSTVDAIKRHQDNESKWFLKLDFSNFFGNSTYEFVVRQFCRVYPFNEIAKNPRGKTAIENALKLCFLGGGLPQGSPLSPYITNIMMIPFDYDLTETLSRMSRKNRKFAYTRYADDLLISCDKNFDPERITGVVKDILNIHFSPFELNEKKTRYGSSSGQNRNLGIMLNKDGNLTIGHQKKRQLKAMLENYIRCHDTWNLSDIQVLCGQINYYRMIERDYIDHIIAVYSEKNNIDINGMLHDDLSDPVGISTRKAPVYAAV